MSRPKWAEVWIDAAGADYLLILRANRDGSFDVVDPQKNKAVSASFQDEQAAKSWLTEDGFDPIEGRYEPAP